MTPTFMSEEMGGGGLGEALGKQISDRKTKFLAVSEACKAIVKHAQA